MSNNPFQESASAWLLSRLFFDTPHAAGLLKATQSAFSAPPTLPGTAQDVRREAVRRPTWERHPLFVTFSIFTYTPHPHLLMALGAHAHASGRMLNLLRFQGSWPFSIRFSPTGVDTHKGDNRTTAPRGATPRTGRLSRRPRGNLRWCGSLDLLSTPLTIPLMGCQIKSFRRVSSGGETMARRRKEERRAGTASPGM